MLLFTILGLIVLALIIGGAMAALISTSFEISPRLGITAIIQVGLTIIAFILGYMGILNPVIITSVVVASIITLLAIIGNVRNQLWISNQGDD